MTLSPLVDTHAHLDDHRLRADWEGVLSRARDAGVVQIVAIGTTSASSAAVVELAQAHRGIFAAVGIHPNEAAEAAEADWTRDRRAAPDSRKSSRSARPAWIDTGTGRLSQCSKNGSPATWSWRTGSTGRW